MEHTVLCCVVQWGYYLAHVTDSEFKFKALSKYWLSHMQQSFLEDATVSRVFQDSSTTSSFSFVKIPCILNAIGKEHILFS